MNYSIVEHPELLFLMLILTMCCYLAFPIIKIVKCGKVERRKAHLYSLVNVVTVKLIFVFLEVIVTKKLSIGDFTFVPPILYYWFSVIILSKRKNVLSTCNESNSVSQHSNYTDDDNTDIEDIITTAKTENAKKVKKERNQASRNKTIRVISYFSLVCIIVVLLIQNLQLQYYKKHYDENDRLVEYYVQHVNELNDRITKLEIMLERS